MRTVRMFQTSAACAALAIGGIALAQDRDQDRTRAQDRERIHQPADIEQENLQRLSRILKMSVQTQDNQVAGQINDIGIHPETGKAIFVIIDPQGEGDDDLKAAPFGALRFTSESQVKLNITKDRFDDAPPFDESGWGQHGGGTNWAEVVFRHYNITFDKSVHHSTKPLLRGTELLNTSVRNQDRQDLGSIDDMIVDTRRGVVLFALVEPQESTGRGDQWVIVPFNAFTAVNAQQRVATMDINRAKLAQAPVFRNMQDLTDNRMDRIYAFYGTERDLGGDRNGDVYGYAPPDREAAGGWQHDGEYGRKFSANAIETVTGEVVSVERFTPMDDMMAGVRMTLRSGGNNDEVVVHLGPAWYIDRQYLRFEKGDNVRVTGSRVQFDGQRVYMATEVRRGDDVLLLRDREGLPRWDATYRVNELPRGSSTISPGRGVDRDDDRGRGRDRDDRDD